MNNKLLLILILAFISTKITFSQNDTVYTKHISFSVDYYTEDVFISQNLEFFKYPSNKNYGNVVILEYFYKNKKTTSDYLSFGIGYFNHPHQYYKLFTNLQAGTRFNIKYGIITDVLAGVSFHNSWPTNSVFNNSINDETEKIFKWGYQKVYFQGSFALGKKLGYSNISIYLKTDFFISYPFESNFFINAVRLGVSYKLSKI